MKHTKKTSGVFAITTAIAFLTAIPDTATAGQDPFIGEINYVAFNYAPVGWQLCNGQTMSISQNNALFALLGTAYGGDGQTTFKLPDMRGKVPIHQGQSTSGTNYQMGQTSGMENATLTINNMPAHNHPATATSASTSAVNPGATVTSTLKAVNADPNASTAQGNSLANGARAANVYSTTAPSVSECGFCRNIIERSGYNNHDQHECQCRSSRWIAAVFHHAAVYRCELYYCHAGYFSFTALNGLIGY